MIRDALAEHRRPDSPPLLPAGRERSRVAVMQPRIEGRGGLEKYCVQMISVLADRMPVDVITTRSVHREYIEEIFGVWLDRPTFLCDYRSTPVPRGAPARSRWEAFQRRRRAEREYEALTREYDLVFGHSMALPWTCAARRSLLICHFPMVRRHRVDRATSPAGWRSLISSHVREQRMIRKRVGAWSRIVVSSEFARRWVHEYWDRDAEVLYPPIALSPTPDLAGKKPWILGVGYFSLPEDRTRAALPHKCQEVMVDAFRELCRAGLRGWELHLAGQLMISAPKDREYLDALRARAPGCPVHLHPNLSHSGLEELYRRASIFWHATGHGLDPEAHPEQMEHFGMVTPEAMGWGCVPVVINRGGQPEIIEPGTSGYAWDTLEELQQHTWRLAAEPEHRQRMAAAAVERSAYFSVEQFRSRMDRILDQECDQLELP